MLEGLLVDLVPLNTKFRDLIHTWRNGEAAYWSSGGDRYVFTYAQVKAQIQRWAEARERGEDQSVGFGIQTKDGTPIGNFFINWLLPHHRLAKLGALIGEPDYWGGGYGTDALLLVVDYAFDWLDMHKVWLNTTSQNARAMRQMEKVGFRLEASQRGYACMDGLWCDGLVYGLLRDEWPGREVLVERLNLRERAEKRYGKAE